ncbi:MAG: RagB/SusD family nutrient uptake outer membrane protein [Petrimonas sp.]|nr:RagB/SusD family nutrient uptake outer membrane protein [Petrimonas sp.]
MKKIYKLLALLSLIVSVNSCTDLTEIPYDTITADNYYQDKDAIIAALVRPFEHGHWCGWDGDRWLLQELTADNFAWPQKGRHGYDGGQWIRLHGHAWTVEEGVVNGGWVGPYQGIVQCNTFIADFEKLDYPSFGLTDADKADHIGQLRTLRAWYYLFLIDFFRNVPISTDNTTIVGQSTPQEVFAFIEKELKESLPGLPKVAKDGRLNQSAAASLLARLYLNSEVWTGQNRYADAKKTAQDVINGVYGTFSLDPDYRGPFADGLTDRRSPENIWVFPHKRNIYEFGWMYNAMMHYQARYSLGNTWGGWNGIVLTPSRDLEGNLYPYKLGKPYEKFSNDDFRKQPFRTTATGYEGFFLIGQQYAYDAATGYGFTDEKILGTEEWNGKPLSYVDQVGRISEGATGIAKGSHVATGEENSGVRLLKFPWLPESKGLFQNNWVAEIRLTEMYYIVAECMFREGDVTGAAQMFDAVRKRNFPAGKWAANSYVQNVSKLTEDEVVDELGREFLGERHRRTDLVRWKRFGNEWWDKPADSKDNTVFPIPSRALNSNKLLEQTTPGF